MPPGSDIYAYLRDLNPSDALWQSVFCDQVKVSCATGQHRFLWSSDTSEEHMECGYTLIPPFGVHDVASRFYPEYIGWLLASKDPANAGRSQQAAANTRYLALRDMDRSFLGRAFGAAPGPPAGPAHTRADRGRMGAGLSEALRNFHM